MTPEEIKYQEFKKQGYTHQQARELALKVCSEKFKNTPLQGDNK